MKVTIKYSFLSFLVILVLAASGGFSITQMICTGSGETSYNFGEVSNCCEADESGTNVASKCCNFTKSNVRVDQHTISKKASPPVERSVVAPLPVFSPFTFLQPDEDENESSGIDPPTFGRDILRLISVLII